MKKEELAERLQEIIQRLEDGCGNNGCQIKAPKGMATNGPCRCGPYHVGRELKELGELVRRPGPWGKEGP